MARPLALLVALALAAPLAVAEDDAPAVAWEEDDEFDFLKGSDKPKEEPVDANFDLLDAEDDDLSSFKLAPAETDVAPVEVKPRGELAVSARSSTLPYEIAGRVALADNYPAQIVFSDADAVVVELPVLIARDGSDYDGVAYWLVAEVHADGMKVAESRQKISKSAVAVSGPTLAFVKLLVPVPSNTGTLEIHVGKATGPNNAPSALFKKAVPYRLAG